MGDTMGKVKLSFEDETGTTIVPNRFIDEYMPKANDAQVKVYLYLLRMKNTGCPFDISDMADAFNHTEKDILRALIYWEKVGILALEYEQDNTISGIRMADLKQLEPAGQAETAGTHDPACAPVALSHVYPMPVRQEAQSVPSQTENPFAKPSYGAAELEAFAKRESISQLLFIAEQYLGRTLSTSDIGSLLFFTDQLHFSDDLIDYLLQYCVGRKKKDFRYIEKVAISWAEAHVTTPEEAEQLSTHYDRPVYQIMNALGKTDAPTRREAEFIRRWREDYSFELSLILEACERTVLATDKHRFEYADKILLSWKDAGAQRMEDVLRLDEQFKKKQTAKGTSQTSADRYNRFMRSSYDYEELEQALLKSAVPDPIA